MKWRRSATAGGELEARRARDELAADDEGARRGGLDERDIASSPVSLVATHITGYDSSPPLRSEWNATELSQRQRASSGRGLVANHRA